MTIESIDDLLLNQDSVLNKDNEIDADYNDDASTENEDSSPIYGAEDHEARDSNSDDSDEEVEKQTDDDFDEFGNDNRKIRERLARQGEKFQEKIDSYERELSELRQFREEYARNNASSQNQNKNNDELDIKELLKPIIQETFADIEHSQRQRQFQQIEEAAHRRLISEFTKAEREFENFSEIVNAQPVDEAMQMALRGMDKPAAFIYAASTRYPAELQRISKIPDPYARIVAMGKLEGKIIKETKPSTSAPKPVSRTQEDTSIPQKKEKRDDTIEDLIAQSQKKKIAQMNLRRR